MRIGLRSPLRRGEAAKASWEAQYKPGVTVAWLWGGPDSNDRLSLSSLRKQTIKFDFLPIRRVRPMSAAFTAMMARCRTRYLIHCDCDMVLKPEAVSTMYERIRQEGAAMVCYDLYDPHLGRPIQGIKIHDLWKCKEKSFPDSPTPDAGRLSASKDKLISVSQVLGEHHPSWTAKELRARYFDLAQHYSRRHYLWMSEIPERLRSKIQASDEDLEAYIGWRIGLRTPRVASKSLGNKIARIVDVHGWAYSHVAQEQKKYSRHTLELFTGPEWLANPKKRDFCLVHVSGPGVSRPFLEHTKELRDLGVRVVGQYSGDDVLRYPYSDYRVVIAPHLYRRHIFEDGSFFMREGIDLQLWPRLSHPQELKVGWAGRMNALKRTHLFGQLCVPVMVKSDHGVKFWNKEGREIDGMKEFYSSISALVILSNTECIPRVALEAIASGIPVIGTAVGCLPAILGPRALVPVDGEQECVEATNILLDKMKDPEFRQSLWHEQFHNVRTGWNAAKLQKHWDAFYDAALEYDTCRVADISHALAKGVLTHL